MFVGVSKVTKILPLLMDTVPEMVDVKLPLPDEGTVWLTVRVNRVNGLVGTVTGPVVVTVKVPRSSETGVFTLLDVGANAMVSMLPPLVNTTVLDPPTVVTVPVEDVNDPDVLKVTGSALADWTPAIPSMTARAAMV